MGEYVEVNLGSQGFKTSRLGFGCMGLTGLFNKSPLPEEDAISLIENAFEKGISLFDTADFYGPHVNEILVGKAIKNLPRDDVHIATKFGIVGIESGEVIVNGTPEYVRSCCEASLERLGEVYIDLYYVHRIDTNVPIEDTMEELHKLVMEGKINYVGLCEASPETIRRAHAVHPITAVQMEWSLWSREYEQDLVPLCRELGIGIGIVPYCPLGHGFFGGKAVLECIPRTSMLTVNKRFKGENTLYKNRIFYSRLVKLAEKYQCTSSQLALAWIHRQVQGQGRCQGHRVIPIPGTTKIEHLHSNVDSLKVRLREDDLKEIAAAMCEVVAGERITDAFFRRSWKFADTPPARTLDLLSNFADTPPARTLDLLSNFADTPPARTLDLLSNFG